MHCVERRRKGGVEESECGAEAGIGASWSRNYKELGDIDRQLAEMWKEASDFPVNYLHVFPSPIRSPPPSTSTRPNLCYPSYSHELTPDPPTRTTPMILMRLTIKRRPSRAPHMRLASITCIPICILGGISTITFLLFWIVVVAKGVDVVGNRTSWYSAGGAAENIVVAHL